MLSISLALGLITSAGIAVANQIALNNVELGSGQIAIPACLTASKVDFTYSIASGGATTVTGVTVTGVSSSCSGQYISLKVINSAGATVDEIIWQPNLTSGDTSITLRANGSSTSSSNSSASSVTTVWPSSQTSPEGLQSFAASSADEFRFAVLATSRAAD